MMTQDKPRTARAVVYDQLGQILLMERFKDDRHYFTMVGGHLEIGETPEEAVVREVREESGLRVRVDKLLYTGDDRYGNYQYIFLCTCLSGEPHLPKTSEEAIRDQTNRQIHRPAFFSLEAVSKEIVYPHGLAAVLKRDKADNFKHCPREYPVAQ